MIFPLLASVPYALPYIKSASSPKALDQPIPPPPLAVAMPEQVSQQIQTSTTFTKVSKDNASSVSSPSKTDRQEVTNQAPSELSSTQILQKVQLKNVLAGELLSKLTDHTDSAVSVAISPDRHTIVSGGDDKTLRVWNLHSGELLNTLIRHRDDVNSVAISPDGRTIVSGSKDKTIRIWSV